MLCINKIASNQTLSGHFSRKQKETDVGAVHIPVEHDSAPCHSDRVSLILVHTIKFCVALKGSTSFPESHIETTHTELAASSLEHVTVELAATKSGMFVSAHVANDGQSMFKTERDKKEN